MSLLSGFNITLPEVDLLGQAARTLAERSFGCFCAAEPGLVA